MITLYHEQLPAAAERLQTRRRTLKSGTDFSLRMMASNGRGAPGVIRCGSLSASPYRIGSVEGFSQSAHARRVGQRLPPPPISTRASGGCG